MEWTRERVGADEEINILRALATSTPYLHRVDAFFDVKLLAHAHTRQIAHWCMLYYREYKVAAAKNLRDLFNVFARDREDDDAQVQLIAKTLERLDFDGPQDPHFNVDYGVDQAEQYLKKRRLEQLREELAAALVQDQIKTAEELIENFHRIERVENMGVSILHDREILTDLYLNEDNTDALFSMPGVLGDLMGVLTRHELIGIVGPSKRGKSFWLMEFGIQALLQRLRVLFVSCEMTQNQMADRIYRNITAQTRTSRSVQIPYFDGTGAVLHRSVNKTGIRYGEGRKKRAALTKMVGGADIHLVSWPPYSAGVADIERHILRLERERGFIPDVIVVDYADILAPASARADFRHQIDSNWRDLRSLAFKRHALVITASHSNKKTFGKNVGQADLAEDRRKLDHVALMVALNQTEWEKSQGIMRLCVLAGRHDEFLVSNEAVVLQCLNLAKPYLDSRWRDDAYNPDGGHDSDGYQKNRRSL